MLWWRSPLASDGMKAGYHGQKQTRRGNGMCSDMVDHEGEKKAVMPWSNNIIVFETYLGYYPVISQSREDVR